MLDFISNYGLFLAKTLTILFAILFVMAAGVSNAAKAKKGVEKGSLVVTKFNNDLDKLNNDLKAGVLDKNLFKQQSKADKKKAKDLAKTEKKEKKSSEDSAESTKKRVYVLDFNGDAKASQVESLRKSITAVLSLATEKDEVILKLESPGGMVHAYGLASSQLKRIREKGITLTICVDKVAASGGYMMACIANKIIAAPFAYVGSIGVLMQLPNFHKLLQEHNIDYEMITAGEYKRTLTMFGENTDKGREKVFEEIQEAHALFKDFIKENRPSLDVESVATGETWFGSKALEKGLVDEILTSDECLVKACADADVFLVKYEEKHPISEKLGSLMESSLDNAFLNWVQRTSKNRFFS